MAAELMNDLPHIDELFPKRNTDANLDEVVKALHLTHQELEGGHGFCLPHKHFDFSPGEVLVFSFLGNEISVVVENHTDQLLPVLAYPQHGVYVPVGFTRDLQCQLKGLPSKVHDQVGVCSSAFSHFGDMLEETDEDKRTQSFKQMAEMKPANSMVTILFPSTEPPTKKNPPKAWCRAYCIPGQFQAHFDRHDRL